MSVLQDQDYIIENTDFNAGLIVAEKELNKETTAGDVLMVIFVDSKHKRSGKVKVSATLSSISDNVTKLRINIQEKNITKAMEEINILDLKDRPCHHLSYGQKKRVSIAAITAMEPDLLILDEPTAWLDSKNTKSVSEILNNFADAGKTLVVSTHDMDFAYDFADYIYVLDKGKIVRQGSRDEVFEDFKFLKELNLNIPAVLKITRYLKSKNIDVNDYYTFLEENNLL